MKTQAQPICYGITRDRTWQQEWYETQSRDASRRARSLRKAGYRVNVEAMGSQVTQVGHVKMTLLTINGLDGAEVDDPAFEMHAARHTI